MLFCSLCHTQFSSRFALKRHQNTKHNETFSGYTCIHCNKTVTTKYSLKKHILICKSSVPSIPKAKQVGGMKKHTHQDNEEASNAPSTGNNSLKFCLKQNWSAIKTYFKCRNVQDIFNFRLVNQKSDIKRVLTNIWINKIQNQVKMNCSLGFILQHRITQEIRYYHSSINNTQIFSSPVRVNSVTDLHSVLDDVLELDLFERAKVSRPDSAWGVLQVTNISFYFSKTDFPKLGCSTVIPHYIKKKKCINSVIFDGNKKYTDKLCFLDVSI